MAADPLIDQQVAIGILVLGGGLLVAAVPGPLATMGETFDAVGSTRTDVEAASWRVLLVRLPGVALALGGAWYLVAVAGLAGGLGW